MRICQPSKQRRFCMAAVGARTARWGQVVVVVASEVIGGISYPRQGQRRPPITTDLTTYRVLTDAATADKAAPRVRLAAPASTVTQYVPPPASTSDVGLTSRPRSPTRRKNWSYPGKSLGMAKLPNFLFGNQLKTLHNRHTQVAFTCSTSIL